MDKRCKPTASAPSSKPTAKTTGCGTRSAAGARETTGVFDFRFALRHHHEEWALGIGALPIGPRAVACNEAVANELLRVNLPAARRRTFGHAQRQRQIADFKRLV